MSDSPVSSADTDGNLPEFSVSELSFALKRMVEDNFAYVRVRGELSGVKRAASGHVYLALKDEKAVLDGVCWRGTAAKLRFQPEDGLEVVCTGRLSTYPGRSRYQIIIEHMEPAGAGALMALLEARRKQLTAEGLFEADRKRPLPYLPGVIGIVTSPTGAVIRDILHRLRDRYPRRVLLWPVLVQGDGAAEQIAAAIQGFNRLGADDALPRPDVLIVARGGGSIEDLWAFNEEVVVRAAAASEIPLISAVGHETDTTLIDFASDRRAPTPTAAAEMAVPVRAELALQLGDRDQRLRGALARLIGERQRMVEGLARGLRRPRDLLAMAQQRFDEATDRLARGLANHVARQASSLQELAAALRPRLLLRDVAQQQTACGSLGERLRRAAQRLRQDAQQRLAAQTQLLRSLSYESVLARGYTVVRAADGAAITTVTATRSGMPLSVQFHDGGTNVVVTDGDAPATRRSGSPRRKRTKDQGSLF